MVPVWGWGALLCLVLKAHHSPSQSLRCCSAHSGELGGCSNRTGLPALCSTAAGLTLTGIMADSHHTWEVERNEKEKGKWKQEKWVESVPFYCWFVSTNAGGTEWENINTCVRSNVKVHPALCSGWCNADMTWTDSPWVIRVFECQAACLPLFLNWDICMLSEHVSHHWWFELLPPPQSNIEEHAG